ncbi:MAG: FAD-dependent oxidoreductase [Candidatus Omnitrophica bacterium]|nr:FAD-dependent oxidoreductase [Candidatus Omnitrophota bacterium]
MKKIIIIGGGFAGISAARALRKSGRGLDIVLIDKKQTFDFLPLLPDCIGRGINPENLVCKIDSICRKLEISFVNEEVLSVNLEQKQLRTEGVNLSYDYLIIASGRETNFYGNDNIKINAYPLDNAADAKRIALEIKKNNFENYIIAGGGYTGIEVATNLRLLLNKAGKAGQIVVVERAPGILGQLPQWMKLYAGANLEKLRIKVYTGKSINKIENSKVWLSDGEELNNCFVIWTAGVETSRFIQDLTVEKNPQGRIKTDAYLRLNKACFAAGDAANFSYKDNFLRMAVQFSIAEGESAAKNIIRSIKGKKLCQFKPVDLGYIIPMANNRSCGKVFGFNVRGVIPTLLHFIMCIYRSCSLKNKIGILRNLSKGG